MIFVSWNVNSLRSAETRFLEFIKDFHPDVLMIQELRAVPSQLSFFLQLIPGYKVLFNPSGKPGYAGTALYYKENLPITNLSTEYDNSILNREGRLIFFKIAGINVFNFYIPNGNSGKERLDFKLKYCYEVNSLINELVNKGEKVVVGGDLNVAHTEIDLFNPKGNRLISGFLPQERKWLDDLIELGMVDSFREFNKEPGQYTWWNLGDPKREKNKGWRFDYFFISKNLRENLKKASILKNVYGSDHCPILLELDIPLQY